MSHGPDLDPIRQHFSGSPNADGPRKWFKVRASAEEIARWKNAAEIAKRSERSMLGLGRGWYSPRLTVSDWVRRCLDDAAAKLQPKSAPTRAAPAGAKTRTRERRPGPRPKAKKTTRRRAA
jgi:hypothetical protein